MFLNHVVIVVFDDDVIVEVNVFVLHVFISTDVVDFIVFIVVVFMVVDYIFVVVVQSRRPSFCPINETADTQSAEDCGKTAVVFSLKNEVGCLVKALRLFQVRQRVLLPVSCFLFHFL